jgi:molecular chaperone DnaK
MDIILGIDFGTNNTVISYFENNQANILLDGVFKTIKTKIGKKDNNYSCGNYVSLDSEEIIHNFKTKIGSEDLDTTLIIFFDHLKKLILKKFKVEKANLITVITVPSNFNDIQREIIRKNFINVGFNVIRIINEPSAAALAYGLTKSCSDDEKILVLDLGAGTLDITVLLKDEGFFEILHSIGLNDLGGNDFTKVIYDHINKLYADIFDENKLWYACQNAKEKLSWVDNYEIKIDSMICNINIKKFENLCNQLMERFINVLNSIKEKYDDIKYIIMVGCSSKMPQLKIAIEKIFKIKPWIYPNLESVVAEGACLYGAILENKYKSNQSVFLVDVLPLSLGVETVDGNFSIIIPKDTPLPAKRTQKYTTDTPSENSVRIKVYQGERVIANKNTLIGQFIFDKITIGNNPQIDITFKVDTNSIITVTAMDKKSGVEKNILIKDIPKLSDNEIENIVNLANEYNKIDEEELIRVSRIYLLNTKIEIIMNNIKLNNLIDDAKKNELMDELLSIEQKLESSDNITLLNFLKKLDEDYINWAQNTVEITDDANKNELEKIMIMELKDELNNKVTFLLNKNPDWAEYLEPIIEKLTETNISLEYLQDKLETLKDLEDEETTTSYKDQLNNVCFFIKNQLEQGLIQIEKLEDLTLLVNNTLLLFDSNEEINWEEKLNEFNENCIDLSSV